MLYVIVATVSFFFGASMYRAAVIGAIKNNTPHVIDGRHYILKITEYTPKDD
ncbi:hypothetical protein LJC74_01085 [Eubacteriales bacterium OttesenSCG-928-A19]|nr:hypothetical protein [Eubacteriales bacterium OttesenSCG-928-A19]